MKHVGLLVPTDAAFYRPTSLMLHQHSSRTTPPLNTYHTYTYAAGSSSKAELCIRTQPVDARPCPQPPRPPPRPFTACWTPRRTPSSSSHLLYSQTTSPFSTMPCMHTATYRNHPTTSASSARARTRKRRSPPRPVRVGRDCPRRPHSPPPEDHRTGQQRTRHLPGY